MGQQEQILGEQRVDLQLGLVDRQVQDCGIDLRRLEARQEAAGVALVDGHVHPRMTAGDLSEQLGEQPAGGGSDHAESRIAGHLVAARRHFGSEIVELVQHPAGTIDDDHAVVGQPAALAIDQGDTQLALETGDVPTDVGLHRVQGTSSGRERAVIGDRHERGQLAEIHLEK